MSISQHGINEGTVFISFSAEIVPHTTEALIASLGQCVMDPDVEDVHLLLSTPGGSVMNGLNLYNVIRGLPLNVTTHNVGNVDSIGNAVFLAGDYRIACPHSTFMFHGVGFDLDGAVRLEEKMLRERLGGIVADQSRIASIIDERTELETAQIEPLFLEAQTKDSTFAAGCGIVDEVRDVEIPANCPVMSLVFNR
jgi:ATP-dependent protease ClpP protease subunit